MGPASQDAVARLGEVERLARAVGFAARAHHSQMRKDGRTPYVSHVFRVCLIVRHLFGYDDPRMLLTALLHDTLEDTDTDLDDLLRLVDDAEVARWVALMTKDKRLPEAERENDYMSRLVQGPWQVIVCKLADMADNLMDMKQSGGKKPPRQLGRLRMYYQWIGQRLPAQAADAYRIVGLLLEQTEAAFGISAGQAAPSVAPA